MYWWEDVRSLRYVLLGGREVAMMRRRGNTSLQWRHLSNGTYITEHVNVTVGIRTRQSIIVT